jgi:hypothetical protein
MQLMNATDVLSFFATLAKEHKIWGAESPESLKKVESLCLERACEWIILLRSNNKQTNGASSGASSHKDSDAHELLVRDCAVHVSNQDGLLRDASVGNKLLSVAKKIKMGRLLATAAKNMKDAPSTNSPNSTSNVPTVTTRNRSNSFDEDNEILYNENEENLKWESEIPFLDKIEDELVLALNQAFLILRRLSPLSPQHESSSSSSTSYPKWLVPIEARDTQPLPPGTMVHILSNNNDNDENDDNNNDSGNKHSMKSEYDKEEETMERWCVKNVGQKYEETLPQPNTSGMTRHLNDIVCLAEHVPLPLPNNNIVKHNTLYQVQQISNDYVHLISLPRISSSSSSSTPTANEVGTDCGVVHKNYLSTPGNWTSCYQLVRQPPLNDDNESSSSSSSTSSSDSSSSSPIVMEEKFVKIDKVMFVENLACSKPSFLPCVLKSNHPHSFGKDPDLQLLIDDLTAKKASLGHLYQLLTYLKRVLLSIPGLINTNNIQPSTSEQSSSSSSSNTFDEQELNSWCKSAISLAESALYLFFTNWEATNRLREHAYYSQFLGLPTNASNTTNQLTGEIDVNDKKDSRNDSDDVVDAMLLDLFGDCGLLKENEEPKPTSLFYVLMQAAAKQDYLNNNNIDSGDNNNGHNIIDPSNTFTASLRELLLKQCNQKPSTSSNINNKTKKHQ